MNKFFDYTKQVFSGKSIGRILFNWQVQKHCQNLDGICLDLGSGANPSYIPYLNKKDCIKVDVQKKQGVDIQADLNQPLPFEENYADNILLFNALYIFKKPEDLLKEIHRVLKPEGRFFLTAPLIFNEAPEPNDYYRFTSQGIKELLTRAGFREIQLHKIGERATAAAGILHNFFLFNLIRFFAFVKFMLLDKCIPKRVKQKHACPLAYFVIAKK